MAFATIVTWDGCRKPAATYMLAAIATRNTAADNNQDLDAICHSLSSLRLLALACWAGSGALLFACHELRTSLRLASILLSSNITSRSNTSAFSINSLRFGMGYCGRRRGLRTSYRLAHCTLRIPTTATIIYNVALRVLALRMSAVYPCLPSHSPSLLVSTPLPPLHLLYLHMPVCALPSPFCLVS